MGGSVRTRPLSRRAAARAQNLEHFAKCDEIGVEWDAVTTVRVAWWLPPIYDCGLGPN